MSKCLMLSSVVMISFCILSKRLFLKYKGLSEGKIVSVAKKECDFAVHS